MKIYNVTIRDATEAAAFEKAVKLLKAYKDAHAAIYGYTKDGKKTVWLVEPILCKTQEDLLKYHKAFNDNRALNQVVMHVLFQRNIDDLQ